MSWISLRFVIDLNVLRSAWTGTHPSGIPEHHSASLFLGIVQKRHELVVTQEIERRYIALFDELKNASAYGPQALNVVHLYFLARQDGLVDYSRYAGDVPPLHDESRIKDEDRDYARLANLTNAVLVTHDEPLIAELRRLRVKVARPEDLEARL